MPTIILKFGSSVLTSEAAIPTAIHEIYRWYRNGYRVVAVVSALGRTTDKLLTQGKAYADTPDPESLAQLLAVGEATSAALVGLALDRAGVPATVLDPSQIDLRTKGSVLDSEVVSVNSRVIERSLDAKPVAVVPGFVGRLDDGRVSLLGRGGSDLTAIFLARELGADRCRLVKDVDGLYEHDPARPGPPPKRYRTIHFDDALALDGRIVQHKSVKYARERGYSFEVACCQSDKFTLLHNGPTRVEPPVAKRKPLRVGLLGLGTVNRGVYDEITREVEGIEVTGIAVRNLKKHAGTGLRAELLTTDPWTIINSDCDVVIEAIGGVSPAAELITAALAKGKRVVTANKAALAALDPAIVRPSSQSDDAPLSTQPPTASLLFSASVGGAAPILESACRIAKDRGIKSVEGVLNGTTNYVLDRLADGLTFDEAVREAQAAGFAEADPTTDLDGTDAAHKLCVIARAAFGVDLKVEEIARTGITGLDPERIRAAADTGCVYRLVGRVRRSGSGVVGTVEPRLLTEDHPFARVRAERNGALIYPFEGEPEFVTGKGAGRWPTAEAVLADLYDFLRAPASVIPLQTGTPASGNEPRISPPTPPTPPTPPPPPPAPAPTAAPAAARQPFLTREPK